MIKYVVPVTVLFGTTAPTFAANHYVVRGPDKKCKIFATTDGQNHHGRRR
jgi:hypothetical protein